MSEEFEMKNKFNIQGEFPKEIRIFPTISSSSTSYGTHGKFVKHYIPRLRPNSKICSKRGETQ